MSRLHVEVRADTTAADAGPGAPVDSMEVADTLEANMQALTVPSGRVAVKRTGGMVADRTAAGMAPDWAYTWVNGRIRVRGRMRTSARIQATIPTRCMPRIRRRPMSSPGSSSRPRITGTTVRIRQAITHTFRTATMRGLRLYRSADPLRPVLVFDRIRERNPVGWTIFAGTKPQALQ